MRTLLVLVVCPSVALINLLYAQQMNQVEDHVIEPWEPVDVVEQDVRLPKPPNPSRVFRDGVLDLIGLYQTDVSPLSIQRCPFTPSCSNYARKAIEKHGLLTGLVYFIDRYVYRENPGMFNLYDMRRLPAGMLKLDDHFFLGR